MGVLRRAWVAPLWAHGGMLAAVLFALVPVVGVSSSFSPDEGVAIIQARAIEGDGNWVVDHPLGGIDPSDRYYPIDASSQGTLGRAPFAKHPAYPVLLAGLDRLGGVVAMVALSVAATVVAAMSGAFVARQVIGGRERPVLWAIGLGSPLLFDSYLLIAHSLGAALATLAVLAALRGIRQSELRYLVLAALAMALAVLARSEALLFAGALAAGIAGSALWQRRGHLLVGAAAVAGASFGAALAEKQMQIALIGASPGGVAAPAIEGGFIGARLEGFLNTWLDPTAGAKSSADLALLMVVVLIVAAAVAARRRPARGPLIVVLAGSAVMLSLVAFVDSPGRTIPGLLVAFPLATVAIVLADRHYLDAGSGRLLLSITAALFVAAILATQYREGGSAEWGGRYFALVIPVMAVLAVDAMSRQAPRLPVIARRCAMGGLVTTMALLSVGAVLSLTRVHTFTDQLLTRITATGVASTPGDSEAEPVLISAYPNIPRLAWASFEQQRWLYNKDSDLGPSLAALLRRSGVGELVFVGASPEDVCPYLGPYTVDPARSWEMGDWTVSTLVRADAGRERR